MVGILDILKSMGGAQPQPPNPATTGGFEYKDPFEGMNPLRRIGIGIGGVGAVNSFRNNAMEQQKMQALGELGARLQSGEITPEQAQLDYASISGDYGGVFGASARKPASIQEWEAYQNMTEEEKARYLLMKRASQRMDLGDRQIIVDSEGNIVQEFEKELNPGDRPETKYAQTQATQQATMDVEKQGAVGKVEDQGNLILKTIEDVLADKEGLEASTGGLFGLKGRISTATGGMTEDQRRFQPKIEQLQGQTFLDAYERLKGGGVITEIEGAKAESALARLKQTQDPEDFRKALSDLRDVVKTGLSRAKSEAYNTDQGYQKVNWDNVTVGGAQDRQTGSARPDNQPARRVVSFGDLQ